MKTNYPMIVSLDGGKIKSINDLKNIINLLYGEDDYVKSTQTIATSVNGEIHYENGDILYRDGSKKYITCSGDEYTLSRKSTTLLETILEKDYMGFGYMPELIKLKETNQITEDEFKKMICILD